MLSVVDVVRTEMREKGKIYNYSGRFELVIQYQGQGAQYHDFLNHKLLSSRYFI